MLDLAELDHLTELSIFGLRSRRVDISTEAFFYLRILNFNPNIKVWPHLYCIRIIGFGRIFFCEKNILYVVRIVAWACLAVAAGLLVG